MRSGLFSKCSKEVAGGLAAFCFLFAAGAARAQVTARQANAARAAVSQTGSPAASRGAAPVTPSEPPATTSTAEATPSQSGAAGRRDPFRPLVAKSAANEPPVRLPPGKAGLVIGQLTVQGIVRGINNVWIAVVDNKTRRAYFLYQGDDLYDGTVTRITEDSVVFQERFSDLATGQPKTREVVKRLGPQ